jgi:hypothetical protein
MSNGPIERVVGYLFPALLTDRVMRAFRKSLWIDHRQFIQTTDNAITIKVWQPTVNETTRNECVLNPLLGGGLTCPDWALWVAAE